MAIPFQSFSIVRGQNKDLRFTVTDNDDAVVDLSGASARFAMTRNPKSSSKVLDSDASPQTATIDLTDALTGIVVVSIDDAVTDTLSGDYYYELKVTSGAGIEVVVARGWISYELSIT